MSQTFFNDGGHGWLSVKRQELIRLGILDKITHYSYQKGDTVYLEEDNDLSTYAEALIAEGADWETFWKTVRNSYRDRSPIRSYRSFQRNAILEETL